MLVEGRAGAAGTETAVSAATAASNLLCAAIISTWSEDRRACPCLTPATFTSAETPAPAAAAPTAFTGPLAVDDILLPVLPPVLLPVLPVPLSDNKRPRAHVRQNATSAVSLSKAPTCARLATVWATSQASREPQPGST